MGRDSRSRPGGAVETTAPPQETQEGAEAPGEVLSADLGVAALRGRLYRERAQAQAGNASSRFPGRRSWPFDSAASDRGAALRGAVGTRPRQSLPPHSPSSGSDLEALAGRSSDRFGWALRCS